jgi:hypothetical protein
MVSSMPLASGPHAAVCAVAVAASAVGPEAVAQRDPVPKAMHTSQVICWVRRVE